MPSSSAQQAVEYAHRHRGQYLEGFKELLRIPSICTDPAYKHEIERCARWIVAEMTRIGLKNCRTMPTAGHPVIYGEWLEAGADQPTVLVYAHYDVQPVDPPDLWQTPPFEPDLRDGRLYARGVVDDKCGVWANLKAIESIFAIDGRLPVNLKVFFEGEEEMGSPNMQPFVAANKDLLRADVFLMCDGGFDAEKPTMAYALRGIVGGEVRVSGPDHDLHSGTYGGAVHNPLHLACKIAGSFHDETGRVTIPGFYDRVRQVDEKEHALLEDAWKVIGGKLTAGAGGRPFWGEEVGPLPVRIAALPTLDVNGVWGGYQGEGMKTIIPTRAGFKVTMRIVPDQDPDEIGQLFKAYVMGFACDTLDLEVHLHHSGWHFTMEHDGPAVEAIQRAFEATLGKRALMMRMGASAAIGGMFQHELGIPMSNLGFGAGDNAHSPNEYIRLDDFFLGIDTAIHVYHNLAELVQPRL